VALFFLNYLKQSLSKYPMTIISAIRLNSEEGILASDQMGTLVTANYLSAIKVESFESETVTALIASTGSGETAIRIINEYKRRSPQPKTADELVAQFEDTAIGCRQSILSEYLRRLISPVEVCGYNFPPSEVALKRYERCIDGNDSTFSKKSSSFILLVADPEDVSIHSIVFSEPPIRYRRSYATRGSAQKLAEPILANVFESQPWEKEKQVDRFDGLAAVISSVIAAKRHESVDGVPHLYLLQRNKITEPSQNNALVAEHAVTARQAGFISKEQLYNVLDIAIFQQACWQDAQTALYNSAGDRANSLQDHILGFK
jgi:hypothetical protein